MSGYTAPHPFRRYRCNTVSTLPSAERCRETIKAETLEAQVWAKVEGLLKHPERIAAEIARKHATHDETLQAQQQEQALLEATLDKCDRDDQHWLDAYAIKAISGEELKGFRAQIAETRKSLQAQLARLADERATLQEAMTKVDSLVTYCVRVRQRMTTFDLGEKRYAMEALDVQVTWTPGQLPEVYATVTADNAIESTAPQHV
jgi:hypothetical protein